MALLDELKRFNERMERTKPAAEVGVCKVCGGVVTEEWTIHHPPTTMFTPIGGPPDGFWGTSGLYCHSCGIKYKHLPK